LFCLCLRCHPPWRRYVSMACPWAHRTLITRALKGLESAIATVVVHPHMGEDGWHFVDAKGEAGDDSGRCEPEPLFGFKNVSQLYRKAIPDYDGRFTVPVLWCTQESTIVNNESSEIIQVRLALLFVLFCQLEMGVVEPVTRAAACASPAATDTLHSCFGSVPCPPILVAAAVDCTACCHPPTDAQQRVQRGGGKAQRGAPS